MPHFMIVFIQGEFNKFVELGIFLYKSRFLFFIFVQCKPLSVE